VRPGSRLGTALVLLALWLFATAWNVDKAYHIDDTAHLEIAQWIAEHPLRPMSGYVHWESQDEPRPIHKTNQPHLYFYAMAGWGSLFGWSERSIHLLLSVFSLVAIVAMYGLATGVTARAPAPLLITSFLALSPAFVVGQNTMVDVPVLAAWLVFYWALLTDAVVSDRRRFLVAALACAAALLIKYTSLLLLPILVVHILARRRRDLWYLAALPVVVLVGWSLFNWLDYGGIHVLERETTSRSAEDFGSRGLVWLLCLGAIAPFAAYFYVHASSRLPRAWDLVVRALVLGMLVALVALMIAFWSGATSEDGAFRFLRSAFVLNGAAFLALALAAPLLRSRRSLSLVDGTLVYWVLSGMAFIVTVAPFIAVRHVLLIVPPLLLLAQRWQVRLRAAWAVGAVAATIGLTSLIAASDWWYADVYRDQAREIRAALPRDPTVWFTGHWGWQWYAKQNGMRQANAVGEEQPAVGDHVVTPRNVSPTSAGSGALILERCTPVPRTSFLHSFAVREAGFYSSDLETLPWALSREPIEEFCIYRRVPG
jgi:hypothetical protein